MKAEGCVHTIKALGDQTRLRILRLLMGGATSVTDISLQLKESNYNVSKHLRILNEAGLVEYKKAGRLRHYAIPNRLKLQKDGGAHLNLGWCTVNLSDGIK